MSSPVVSFDLDGVLIRNPFATCVVPRFLAHLRSTRAAGHPLLDAHALDAMLDEEWSARQRAGRWVAGYDWDDIYRTVAERLGATEPPPVAGWVQACCASPGSIALLSGARDALRLLTDADVHLVVVTNGFAIYQEPVLEALGILPSFREVRAPDRTGVAKPDPAVFTGLDTLIAHIGDMPSHDVLAARRAGVRSILVGTAAPGNEDPYAGLYGPVDPAEVRPNAVAENPLQAARIALAWTTSERRSLDGTTDH